MRGGCIRRLGIGRQEKSAGRASGARYGARKIFVDFCLRPRPHLGACSQAKNVAWQLAVLTGDRINESFFKRNYVCCRS